MATTTNYGWTTPDDTALVKDGAAAIRTLGSSVDTTTKALNPSTTLGDVEYRSSTANTNTRLGIGTTGQVLTVAGGVPTWATPGGGGLTLLSTTTLAGASTTISVSPSGYVNLYILATKVNMGSDARLYLAPNGSTTISQTAGVLNYTAGVQLENFNLDYIKTNDVKAAETNNSFVYQIFNVNSTTEYKNWSGVFGFQDNNNRLSAQLGSGIIRTNSAISSLVFSPAAGTFSGGTVLVYGVK